ncbi:MAG: TolC family protein [Deferribacteres bacterium]|nr:TolC family protein [Deferribacteres bacterium]
MRGVFILIFFLVPAVVWAKVFTLKDCIAYAVKNNPEVGYFKLLEEAKRYDVSYAASGFFPVVNANIYWKRYQFEGLEPVNESYWGVTASWELFSGLSTLRNWQRSRIDLESVSEQVRQTVIDVAFEVVSAYTDLLSKKALLEARKKSLDDAVINLSLVKKRYEVGFAPFSDLITAKSRVEDAKHELIKAESEVAKAKGRLAVAMGLSVVSSFEIKEERLPLSRKVDFNRLWESALKMRPDLKRAELSIEAQEKRVSAVKAEFMPVVGITGEYGMNDQSLFPDDKYSWSIRAWVRIPLFSGFSTWSKLRRERAYLKRAEFGYKMVKLNAQKELWNVFQDYRSAQKQFEAAKKYLAAAMEDMRVMRGKYANGLVSVVDLTTTQANLADARAKLVYARYKVVESYYALMKATGFVPGLER